MYLRSTRGGSSVADRRRLTGENANVSILTNGAGGQSGRQVHQPGSIVRVTLKNFVTYTNAEFLPGPSLNMVIGPNGTGKSTLVCAICLGLGWKTEHLGRAKDVSEFVKHGATSAAIEIELARDPSRHQINPVVKHMIRRGESTKSVFFLNGKQCPQKHIMELCRSFSIQVDNLCQFLPQDRVVEFAALSPVDLLTQTQRAAAPEHLVQWHDRLKDLRYKHKSLEHDQRGLNEALRSLESRQNDQRADVERLRERAEVKEKLEALELLRPLPRYRELRGEHLQLKEQYAEAQHELRRLDAVAQPSKDAVIAKQKYRQTVDSVVQQKRRHLERAEGLVGEAHAAQQKIQDDMKTCRAEVEAEQNNVKRDKENRARLVDEIAGLKKRSEMAPPQMDTAEYNERGRELTRRSREYTSQAEECHRQAAACSQQLQDKKSKHHALLAELDSLKTQAGRQENKLRRASEDAYRAWQWIQQHRDEVPGNVYGPPIVTCSVKDPKYANSVEGILQRGDLMAFTVTSRETYGALNKILYDDLRLADVHIRIMTNSNRPGPPIPRQQLSEYGLDCYMTDLISGPDDVIAMLCQNRRIDATAVAFKPLTQENLDAIGRTNLSSYVTPTDSFVITRRQEYGDQGISTRNTRIKPASFFGGQAVDTQAERELQERIAEIMGEMSELSRIGKEHQQRKREFDDKRRAAEAEREELLREKSFKQQAMTQYNGLSARMKELQTKLDKMALNERTLQARQQTSKDRESKLGLERGQAVMSYVNRIRTLCRFHTELFEAEILAVEAQSGQERCEMQHRDATERLKLRQEHVDELKARLDAKRDEAKRAAREYVDMQTRRTARQEAFQAEQPEGQTVAELEDEIASLAARLDMYHEGDPNVMREFEDRAAKMERTRQRLQKVEHDVGRLGAEMESLRSEWEPELDELVDKISDAFSDNFQRIGCAGEVRVHKDPDDYAAWSIQVLVKFREGEELSVLDSRRQSGGERAVSTIFYLMALQSLARAPFRVVDEINQGMDPRNERLVHSRIVDIACAEHTSQYFLITPKLLPNLEYHPSMKVHCIASGEYMPADHKKLGFAVLAEKALAAKLARESRGVSAAV